MANFEGLIRQALQNQNAGDPAVRQRIYQSSRNALAKMLQKSPDVGEEAAQRQFASLEASIASIEADYVPQAEAGPQIDVVLPDPAPIAPEPETPAPQASVEPPQPARQDPPVPAKPSPAAPSPAATEETDPVLAMLEQASLGTTARPGVFPPAPGERAPQIPPSVNERAAAAPANDPFDDPAARYLDDPADLQGYTPEPLFPLPQSEPGVDIDHRVDGVSPPQDWDEVTEPTIPGGGPVAQPSPVPDPVNRRSVEIDLDDAAGGGWSESGEPATAESLQQNDLDNLTAEREPYPVYNRKNPILRRIWPIALVLGILLVILWLLYALFTNMGENGGSNGQSEGPGPVGETQLSGDGSATVTLLEPTDLSALVTAGRGTAELTTVQNEQMLRLQSVRQDGQANDSAEPILIEMERGVLQQIMGKPVTVELYAKSGLSGPAQFAIECSVDGESVCGRKRFRVGQQPERIVFSMDLKNINDAGARAFLALNTDITTEADSSGKGDIIDLIYARLRFEP